MFKIFLLILVLINLGECDRYPIDRNNALCDEYSEYCCLTFVVEECLTIPLEENEAISGDGSYKSRMMCINGTYPGPAIVTFAHQKLSITFINNLDSDNFVIHFHGQHQRGSNRADGFQYVTQLPITPGSSFTHNFEAYPTGTFWYHAHNYLFYSLNGPFIVLPRYRKQVVDDSVLMISDFNTPPDYLRLALDGLTRVDIKQPIKEQNPEIRQQMEQAVIKNLFSPPVTSYCLNGKCMGNDPNVQLPLEVINIEQNSNKRLRLINSAAESFFACTVDKHKFEVISLDGMDIQTVENVDTVLVSPGERVDIVIKADQPIGNYWIRCWVQTYSCKFFDTNAPLAYGILRYDTAPEIDPTTEPNNCTNPNNCLTVGCYAKQQFQERKCLTWTDLNSYKPSSVYGLPNPSNVKFFNFDLIGFPLSPRFGINYLSYRDPLSILSSFYVPQTGLTFPNIRELHNRRLQMSACEDCEPIEANSTRLCSCYNSYDIDVSRSSYIYFVFSDLNRDLSNLPIEPHPAHLHGHSFEIIKYYIPGVHFNDTECLGFEIQKDILCDNQNMKGYAKFGCLNARFRKTPSDLKTRNPVLKDTVVIPVNGYVLVRFKPDNPGLWAMHCHNFIHHLVGMLAIINEQ
ncbi:unnamed protein product [Brachionus calyciflorus]|uniref:Uncharacterized protein n=1 Tax=Brachionus calyciflorus TaxID=104777 RepID=A0A814I7E7_9BILA|nr:unnamed protein product [Brachionus calyciflorus]